MGERALGSVAEPARSSSVPLWVSGCRDSGLRPLLIGYCRKEVGRVLVLPRARDFAASVLGKRVERVGMDMQC